MEIVILNIAMPGHKRIPSRDGGIEVVVEELSSRMVESGHNITCFNRKCDSANAIKLSKVSVYRGINLKEIFTVNKKGLAAMTSGLFACIATALRRYDVVHIHAEGPAFFSFFSKTFWKKVVVTIHGTHEIIGTTEEKSVKSTFCNSLVAHHNSNKTCELVSLVINKNSLCTSSKYLLDS